MNEPTTAATLTDEQKTELYRAGKYMFPPPPVCTVLWDEAAWIRFVDRNGKWLPNTGK